MSKSTQISTHPDLFVVETGLGEYSASLKALKTFEAGSTLASIDGVTNTHKAYTSVQFGSAPGQHISLNSDLVYANHSCEPSVYFDLSSPDRSRWHVRAARRIEKGEYITFFYPSTEWDMEQPFECRCGAKSCLRYIRGAKYLTWGELKARGFIAPWIRQCVRQRDAENSQELAAVKL
ncbi:hypothetical protein NLI96_g1966 [Meripilus lineatus]|uniref:SET domain-containing protein n=1 Tax=Meripilus lineatus TaxID=2056292 RepID=A0AAD5VBM6_9APHY|nr:hypothetical protein NLI96_g1966 [Physisporinus lineatus]